MANPMFTNKNGAASFIWTELPTIPSDRPDLPAFANTDRAIIEYASAGMLVGRKALTKRGKVTFGWERITQAMVESLKVFAEKDYFRFYPDAGEATYFDVYISNEFAPRWQPGGVYNLTLEIKQYSP